MDGEHEARHESVLKDIERLQGNDRELFGRMNKLEQEAAEQRGMITAKLEGIAQQNAKQEGLLAGLQASISSIGREGGEEAKKKQAALYAAVVAGVIGMVSALAIALIK